jgi:hypothetical protein
MPDPWGIIFTNRGVVERMTTRPGLRLRRSSSAIPGGT